MLNAYSTLMKAIYTIDLSNSRNVLNSSLPRGIKFHSNKLLKSKKATLILHVLKLMEKLFCCLLDNMTRNKETGSSGSDIKSDECHLPSSYL